jgi:hypothetical protein
LNAGTRKGKEEYRTKRNGRWNLENQLSFETEMEKTLRGLSGVARRMIY